MKLLILTLVCSCFHIAFGQSTSIPIHWGHAKNHVQVGFSIEEGEFSFRYHIYARYRGPNRNTVVSDSIRYKVIYTDGDGQYILHPASIETIRDDDLIRQPAGGYHRSWGRYLYRDKDVLLTTMVVERRFKAEHLPCFEELKTKHATQVEVFMPGYEQEDRDRTILSGTAPVPYCTHLNSSRRQLESEARFLQKVLKNASPEMLPLAADMATDTSYHHNLRGIAARFLADLNSTESRNVLYTASQEKDDPELGDMLFFLFKTRDPRGPSFFRTYARHPLADVRATIVSGIGEYKAEDHLDLLATMAEDSSRMVRRETMNNLKAFATDEARNILYTGLRDGDLGVRILAVHALKEVGNTECLPHLLGFIERENPNNVGYIEDAYEAAEQITGQKLKGDIEKLRCLIK